MVYSPTLERFRKEQAKEKALYGDQKPRKPFNYKIPALSDSSFWPDYAKGWISEEEAHKAHDNFYIKRRRAKIAIGTRAEPPKRFWNLPPVKTEQYTRQMSAEFLDDRRLSQGAKNLLTRLVALAGHKNEIDTNKTSLAKITNRSTRTIQRYLHELTLFGYIHRLVRTSALTKFDIGLKIFIDKKAMPFFHRAKEVITQLLEAKNCRFLINSYIPRETETSHINNLIYINREAVDKLYVDNSEDMQKE